VLNSVLSWEFAEEIGVDVSQAGNRWFTIKFKLIKDIKAINIKFKLVELKFAESDVEFAESGVKFIESDVNRSKFEVEDADSSEFKIEDAGSSEFEAEDDSGVNNWFDINLTVLIKANVEIVVKVGRELYLSTQYVLIYYIL